MQTPLPFSTCYSHGSRMLITVSTDSYAGYFFLLQFRRCAKPKTMEFSFLAGLLRKILLGSQKLDVSVKDWQRTYGTALYQKNNETHQDLFPCAPSSRCAKSDASIHISLRHTDCQSVENIFLGTDQSRFDTDYNLSYVQSCHSLLESRLAVIFIHIRSEQCRLYLNTSKTPCSLQRSEFFHGSRNCWALGTPSWIFVTVCSAGKVHSMHTTKFLAIVATNASYLTEAQWALQRAFVNFWEASCFLYPCFSNCVQCSRKS